MLSSLGNSGGEMGYEKEKAKTWVSYENNWISMTWKEVHKQEFLWTFMI